MNNDLDESVSTCFDLPATQGPQVLALLVEIDPLNHPDSEKRYQERAERFCQNLMWRRITGDVNPEYINAAVDRLFTAAEVIDEIKPETLQNLKFQICQLYFG
jgi:hypothetical protein